MLVQDCPKVQSSYPGKLLASKVPALAALRQDVGHGLSPFSAFTDGVVEFWYPPAPEVVSQSNLLGAHLD
jgi:hypothetical protein